jgi:hypothetical protein
MLKLRFECHYCEAVFQKFSDLVNHFKSEHADGEYIVIEVEDGVIEHTS